MEKIHAWVRDPHNNLFKGMSKRSALFELFCENPKDCDLFVKESSCLLCSGLTSCRFGKKRETVGPTPRAQGFRPKLAKWREDNKEWFNDIKAPKAYNRIFYANGFYYLPYSWMADGMFLTKHALAKKWVAKDELTAEVLEKICTARPEGLGGVIGAYQKKQIPKFISDLKMHYPELFELLSEEQQARVKDISYIGRSADITTCPPGEFVISSDTWRWDGRILYGRKMIFQPVEGDIEIRIIPNKGESVKITNNNQVSETTRFLD
ncbi:MAG: hypothetical protein KAV87_31390 [Desulfobacteraceae bacterium]|nr:hypothetical protein [Desulfobacteraceae bacterium]